MVRNQFDRGAERLKAVMYGTGGLMVLVVLGAFFAWAALNFFRVDVPTAQMAILMKKTGLDLKNDQEVAESSEYKGIQKEFLLEGKHWLNPYHWDWQVIPQQEVPHGKMGVLVSLSGEDLGYGEFLAHIQPNQDKLRGGVLTKGIVPDVLREGRYPLHPYLFELQIHDPVIIPAGYRGVLTNLAGPLPENPNQLLVEQGFRGVQKEVLDAGTYYLNPYEYRVDLVDCRSQRFNLLEKKDMGFPSKDGFWVSLDGIIEFQVDPERAAEVYVTYNDSENGPLIDEELVRKIVMPIARSYCRVEGSKKSGREFITGDTRMAFEENFERVMREECEPRGVTILQALITGIRPPQQIAEPVRERELAKQDQAKYLRQIELQLSEQVLAMDKELIKRKQEQIKTEQQVVKITTEAMREQEVAVTKANERLAVAKLNLEAAEDEAEAIRARGKADADVIDFNNEAEAAGWKRAVEAFGGEGGEFAKYLMNQKLAPAYRRIMANSDNSPIMKIFESFSSTAKKPEVTPAPTQPATNSTAAP